MHSRIYILPPSLGLPCYECEIYTSFAIINIHRKTWLAKFCGVSSLNHIFLSTKFEHKTLFKRSELCSTRTNVMLVTPFPFV